MSIRHQNWLYFSIHLLHFYTVNTVTVRVTSHRIKMFVFFSGKLSMLMSALNIGNYGYKTFILSTYDMYIQCLADQFQNDFHQNRISLFFKRLH